MVFSKGEVSWHLAKAKGEFYFLLSGLVQWFIRVQDYFFALKTKD